jgi:hypothetical protein
MLDTVFARYDVQCAVAEMDTRNEASIRLAESLGFRRVNTVFDAASFKGSTSHEHVYRLTRPSGTRADEQDSGSPRSLRAVLQLPRQGRILPAQRPGTTTAGPGRTTWRTTQSRGVAS